MKLLIVCAMKEEEQPILRRLQEGLQAEDVEIVLEAVGIGKVNAAVHTALLLEKESYDMVINIGLCGGMLPQQKVGDIVIGEDYVQSDFDLTGIGGERGVPPVEGDLLIPCGFLLALEKMCTHMGVSSYVGTVATGDVFLCDNKKKQEIVAQFAPVAYDMESAAIAQTCTLYQTPFVAVRAVSDTGDDAAGNDFATNLEDVPDRLASVLLQTLANW